MTNIVRASAPSNIALIKYMGKTDTQKNRATNASLSYTLDHLRSFVEIAPIESGADVWRPLRMAGADELNLSPQGQEKFLNHFSFLKKDLGISGSFEIRSANNFVSDAGLASSASSFAALTRAAADLARAQGQMTRSDSELASLSQRGSGSSCRSFFSPWAVWDKDGARSLDLPIRDLIHAVVVVEAEKKEVSSSQAHLRVVNSDLFAGRIERAHLRFQNLVAALESNQWSKAVEICWREFWDMHALFETSHPPFGYMSGRSIDILNLLRKRFRWGDENMPICTMDAGANVHLLFASTARDSAQKFLMELRSHALVIDNLRTRPGVE